ncbi:DUF2339 domain-containing protein [Kiritimatiellaeota bacterium B1221]|nr:DUF2339 domain-containing protein [Kiritimatiellaeota bacterium B1221]
MLEISMIVFWIWILPVTFIILSRLKRMEDRLEKFYSSKKHLEMLSPPRVKEPGDLSVSPPVPAPAAPVSKSMKEDPEIELDQKPEATLPPPLPPKPVVPPPAPRLPKPTLPSQFAPASPPPEPGAFELAAKGLLSRIWNWILVGEEYRKPGVSVEFAVATNWLVRIGVLVLVVGVGFFLDYSARMGWLGDVGKVALAGMVGTVLVGWGMLNLNRKYHLLGQGLVGAGLAILYTTMFAAHQRYELISPVVAFVLMFLVTLGAAGISVYSQSLLIAVLGLIGGYLTPFLLPDSGEVAGLLVYLAVLGTGVLLISLRRQWLILNFMAFLFTSLHVFAMLVWWRDPVSFQLVMPFLVIYFLIFSSSAFMFQVLQKEKSTWLDLGFLLMNAGGFFLSSRELILHNCAREWVAAVSLFLALFYALHFFVFVKRKGRDRGLALCFMSLMNFFLMLSIPLYFSGDWWTLGWSLLALVLLWGSQKVNSRFMEQVAFGIFFLSVCRYILLDLEGSYAVSLSPETSLPVYLSLFWERLMKMGIPLASLGGALWLQNHPRDAWPEFQLSGENDSPRILQPDVSAWVLKALLLGLGVMAVHLEVVQSIGFLFSPLMPAMLTLVWVFGAGVLLHWTQKYPKIEALQFLLLGCAVAMVVKWLAWDLPDWNFSVELGRYTPYNPLEAGMRLLDFLLRGAFLVFGYKSFRKSESTAALRNFFGYAALANLWLFSTFEVNSLLGGYVPGLRSGGLSVFWGLFALCLISAGLFRRHRPLRFLGLAQFTWVAFKVFFHDLASLDPIYKIVAFILLGMILLAGAFVYLRFQDRFALESEEA